MCLVPALMLIKLLPTGAFGQIEFTNMTSKYLPEHLSFHGAPEDIYQGST